MTQPPPPHSPFSDSPCFSASADASAVDAWLEAHASGEARSADGDPRVARIASLMGLLSLDSAQSPSDAATRATLVDVTMARVLREPTAGLAGRIMPPAENDQLNDESAAAVDAIFADESGETTNAASALCALIEAGLSEPAAETRESRITSTLARIQAELESQESQYRLSPALEGNAPGPRAVIRLADLASIAATFLIVAAVAWPLLLSVRERAREEQCAANLGRAALGFTLYAGDHQGQLPSAQASLLGGSWWDVGTKSRSHSANLYRLVSGNYASLNDLSCPGNAGAPTVRLDTRSTDWSRPEEVSFSYQLFGSRPPLWGQSAVLVVLSDRSPVVERARKGEMFDSEASSLNHSGHAQNILFSDGAVRLYLRPVLENGDNIWLPATHQTPNQGLTGRERPANERDAFVGP